ncbi:MAG TPA: MopE-related protein, partial [Candidatus Nanopelagicales bacterium]|nr:MopE-related protein [Candidatus Nanopelagicales bacterium]
SGRGLLSVTGGSGGTGVSHHGGGGGGGLILLATGDGTKGSLAMQVDGGQSGPCAVTAGSGVETVEVVGSCLDVDEDGHMAAICGGDDCDDGDPAVFPGAADDTCDGEDNDCSGIADDALSPAACPDNHGCEAGQCVPLGEGGGPPDAGPGGSAAPARLEYQSGCGVGMVPARRSAAPALLGLGLLGALAWRRRVVARAKVS